MRLLDRLRSRFSNPPSTSPDLDDRGRLRSDLWIDRPDASRQIDERLERGELSPEQARNLHHFAEHGYVVISPAIDEAIYEGFEASVDRLWRERPRDVAYAYHSLLKPFADASEEHRKPTYRIADLHTYSDEALALYLHPGIFEYVELIFGEPAVATQSLYFEWGSQQALHRDPIHVRMTPPAHLLAAWIALQDVGPECGPLRYVPGSHRLPYYQYEPGRFVFDHSRDGDAEMAAATAWDERHCAHAGLEEKVLTCQRGDVLIWHHSLLHGGTYPTDPEATRKSFVVHYSTLGSMKEVRNSYLEPAENGEGEPRVRQLASTRVLERQGCHGFDSPLHAEARQGETLHSEGDGG